MMRSTRFISAIVILFAITAAGTVLAQSSANLPNRNRAPIEVLPDGRLRVAGKIYESREAYYHSEHFRASGGPCGTVVPQGLAMPRGGDAGDCTLFSNTPDAAYDPGVARYRIPVVVHVIKHTSGAGALTMENIQGQIDVLNDHYLGVAASGALGENTEIEFRLATTDPAGNPTTGVTETVDNDWFVENGSYWQTLAWDPTRYMNVYTLNLDPQGFLGYIQIYPAEAGAGTPADRVVIHWGTFGAMGPDGPPYNLGRTLVHEVGHYLGLFHPFDGGCGNASVPGCRTTGDLICDTNPQLFAHYSSNCQTETTCGSPDPIDNYMAYSDDLCLNRFTPEQAQRMRCSLQNYRSNLFETIFDTGVLSVTPNIIVSHTGLPGGPFSNAQTTYSAGNPGNSPVDYEIEIDSNFGLLLNGGTAPLMGSLQPGEGRQVNVTLDTDAVNALDAGDYAADIVFSDLTNGTQTVRTHTLAVGLVQFCMSGVPVAIPDNNNVGVTNQVVISQSGTINDLDIGLSINHAWVGDLVVSLTHVDSGTSATLINQIPGGGGFTCFEANFQNILLDDDGTGGNIQGHCVSNLSSPPGYLPANPLSVFDGLDISGTWRIRVADLDIGVTGQLINWCINARLSPAPEPEPEPEVPTQTDTDQDGVPDAEDNCPQMANADQADMNLNNIGDACEFTLALAPCPDTITLPATSPGGATVDFELPPAAGGFGNISVSADPSSGSTFKVGTTQVKVTATNAAGSIDNCTFDVVVTDNPTVTMPMVDGGGCGGGSAGCGGGAMLMPMLVVSAGILRRRSRKHRR